MYDQIAWFPLCAGLTAVGLVLSFLALRRKGVAAGLRAAAWSLVPLAAYLLGAVQTLWNVGSAIVGFFTGLVFSPSVWAGVALTGLAVVLYLVSGVLYTKGGGSTRASRRAAKGGAASTAAPSAGPATPAGRKQAPAAPQRPQVPQGRKQAADDDFSDIEDILRRRGIS
ncbi:hypothetical protein SAMN05421505_1258 [Sinosporangium album]|uniref:Cellulose synthase n=1 Tax=Sinosporangium album TaxID=504805 RepID=A0A1G8FYT0_9ACTN|nr:cellulose synthase [Sinosporangium album]SDH87277.1 hypothetical protein SAMN05421505_1258 [Sinosporangium album]